jgi:hypothetical protein
VTVANVLDQEELVVIHPCRPTNTSSTPLIRHDNRKQRTPIDDVRNRAKLELTDEDLAERFIVYNKDLGDRRTAYTGLLGNEKP